VLYRTNAQSRTIEDGLRRAGIAYKIIGGVRFYERKEVKDTLAYLRLALNRMTTSACAACINVPPAASARA
jgi:DNA helicase-2/ATP-dependent DNA helicase PcrA